MAPTQPTPDSPIANSSYPGTTSPTEYTDKCLYQEREFRSPEIDSQETNQNKSDVKLSLMDIDFVDLSSEGEYVKEGTTPAVEPDACLPLKENHFATNPHQDVQDEEFVANLESYDIVEANVNLRESNLSNGQLQDSDDISNPLYAEKLSRIINRRSRLFNFAPNDLTKPEFAENSRLLDSSSSHSEIVSSITMEQDLQPTTQGTPSGNRWSAIRLPFTHSTMSLSVSDRAIWIIEGGKGYVYWCKTKEHSISWQHVGGISAQQVSTSYHGKIVLVVSKDHQLYTREGISSDRCGGKSWLKLTDGKNIVIRLDRYSLMIALVLRRNNLHQLCSYNSLGHLIHWRRSVQ